MGRPLEARRFAATTCTDYYMMIFRAAVRKVQLRLKRVGPRKVYCRVYGVCESLKHPIL